MSGWSGWGNVVTLVLVGGVVSLVLALVAGTSDGHPETPLARRAIPQGVGVIGVLAALVAGVVLAVVAASDPESWWLAPLAWAVWIAGAITTFALMALLFAVDRRLVRR